MELLHQLVHGHEQFRPAFTPVFRFRKINGGLHDGLVAGHQQQVTVVIPQLLQQRLEVPNPSFRLFDAIERCGFFDSSRSNLLQSVTIEALAAGRPVLVDRAELTVKTTARLGKAGFSV